MERYLDGLNFLLDKAEGKYGHPGVLEHHSSVSNLNLGTAPLSFDTADIVILTALSDPEQKFLKDVFSSSWESERNQNIVWSKSNVKFHQKNYSIVCASPNNMGMVSMSILAMKAIALWTPKIICMTGVCAGSGKEIDYGHIIVSKSIHDYMAGKLKNGKFVPDMESFQIEDSLCTSINRFINNQDPSSKILDSWQYDGKPVNQIKCHLAPTASGSAVIADEKVFPVLKDFKRNLLGLDMEAFGLAKAASEGSISRTKFLIVKSVTDFADGGKNDLYRKFCSYASAKFLKELFESEITYIL